MDRATLVHETLLRRLAAGDLPNAAALAWSNNSAETRSSAAVDAPLVSAWNGGTESRMDSTTELDAHMASTLFAAQCLSRVLDLHSRRMQREGQGFYTIGSSGHEGMAAVAAALELSDMAFLHYRDAAFQIARAMKAGRTSIIEDMLLSFACSRDDPISGGRHKVLGSRELMIPPQTSTIASHLPKAVGAAWSIPMARRFKPALRVMPEDAIVVASFGDASLNHSTAQGAINTSSWIASQSLPLPLLWVCEDNGIGISTPTPSGWVQASMQQRPGIRYFKADGLDLYDAYCASCAAVEYVRLHRRPAFLHIRTVRLYGHAGSDIATSYLPVARVEQEEANDPLLHSARLLAEHDVMSVSAALQLYRDTLAEVEAMSESVCQRPRLQTSDQVMASLLPPRRSPLYTVDLPSDGERRDVFGRDWHKREEPQPLARLINWALRDIMLQYQEVVLMGQDIGRKGGVYGVTQQLQTAFGKQRVLDTLLDEQSILGLAIGMAHNGFLPIPEIQFLAYLHNAEDQLRGEAASLPFFSNGQFTNPMVLRIAGLGYQKGFGGHFHNDNSLAVLRDIPGIVLACPSNGREAVLMLRECVRLAREEQRVVVFVEPIARYLTRDLDADGDGGWMHAYPSREQRLPLGEVVSEGNGNDLVIVTYGNGMYLSRQAVSRLPKALQARLRIVDLCWLMPLPIAQLDAVTATAQAVLIVDECRSSGSVSEALMTHFHERFVADKVQRITALDSFIATGPAHAATLPNVEQIVGRAEVMMQELAAPAGETS